jgi:tRNA(adenine34) deaminase
VDHDHYMRQALALADEAEAAGEVPVGALVVVEGVVVGRGFNQPISTHDPTAHAEVVALRAGGRQVGNYRLPGAWLYVTVEPCVMCVGAALHARVTTIVYGASEPRAGAVESSQRVWDHPALNHRLTFVGGVMAAECRDRMRTFFLGRR